MSDNKIINNNKEEHNDFWNDVEVDENPKPFHLFRNVNIEHKTTKEENNRISFCIGNLNFGTCAYINGRIGIQFRVVPFSKLSKAIKVMKKYVKTKGKKGYETNMKNIIDSYMR